MENPKICYLAYPQSIHTQRWIKYFAKKGYEVHIVTFDPYHFDEKNIIVYTIKRRRYIPFFNFLRQIVEIKKTIDRIKPDIVHAHYATSYGKFLPFIGNYPKIVSVWGSDVLIAPKKSFFTRLLLKYTFKKVDVITIDAKFIKKVIKKFGANSNKVKLVSHGVDLSKFYRDPKYKEIKRLLKIGDDSPVVVSTRSFELAYDVETVIRSIPVVLKEIKNACFIIIGKGSLKEELIKIAKELRVYGNTRFIGIVSHEKMPMYLSISDIYVSTSLSDTTSVSLLEAMACRLPVIATDLEGNREWIKDGINGFLIPKRDYNELGTKIIYLLKNRKNEFATINRAIVEKKADYMKEMEKMSNLYKKNKR